MQFALILRWPKYESMDSVAMHSVLRRILQWAKVGAMLAETTGLDLSWPNIRYKSWNFDLSVNFWWRYQPGK